MIFGRVQLRGVVLPYGTYNLFLVLHSFILGMRIIFSAVCFFSALEMTPEIIHNNNMFLADVHIFLRVMLFWNQFSWNFAKFRLTNHKWLTNKCYFRFCIFAHVRLLLRRRMQAFWTMTKMVKCRARKTLRCWFRHKIRCWYSRKRTSDRS